MALKEYYIGSHGPYFVDDTSDQFIDPGQLIMRSELASSVDNIVASTADIGSIEAGLLDVGDKTDGNYLEIEADGTLELHGAATVYEDLIGSALELEVSGVGAVINATDNTLEFSTLANLNDYGFDNFQIRHAWDGSTVYPHVHWEQTQNNTPNWLLQCRWQKQGQAKTTAWTNYPMTTNAFTYTSGTLNQISHGSGLAPPAGAGLSDIIEIRILRDNANTSGVFAGADPYTATVGLTSVDIHIRENTLGSRQEYIK